MADESFRSRFQCISALLALYVVSFAVALVWEQNALSEEAARRTVILDEHSYLRAFYRFQPDYLNPELVTDYLNPELVTDPAAATVDMTGGRWRSQAEATRANSLVLRDKDWTYHVLTRSKVNQYPMVDYPHPSADWPLVDFDDASWIRRVVPLQVGLRPIHDRRSWAQEAYTNVQAVYFRSYFDVSDARQVGDLLLDITYRGGIRVLVNGHEVARGHLPAGELESETSGEAYPLEVYLKNKDAATVQHGDLVGDVPAPATPETENLAVSVERWNEIYQQRERRLESVRIPANLLREGSNVLAIELRRAQIHPVVVHDGSDSVWPHLRLTEFTLTASHNRGVTVTGGRPKGVQVWFEDINRRVLSVDYLEPGSPGTEWRVSGARNGRYAGQLVIGTDRELSEPQVMVSELRGEHGNATISAEAISVFGTRPRKWGSIGATGVTRGQPQSRGGPAQRLFALARYAGRDVWGLSAEEQDKLSSELLESIQHHDHLTDDLPESIDAGTARPFWLSLRIPEQTPPGVYRGQVTVRARGLEPVRLPVVVEVLDWRMPDPRDFETVVGIDTEFWHHPGMFRIAAYSPEHFETIRRSYKLLGRIGGGNWIEVPVRHGAYGTGTPSLIRWIRRKDGTLNFDFADLDKYLDIVIEEAGKPRVICFSVDNISVQVLDEATGEEQTVRLGANDDSEVREAHFGPFTMALHRYMRSRGLDDVMHWGLPGDNINDPDLRVLLDRYAPEVSWARASHDSMPDAWYRATSTVYGPNYLRNPMLGEAPDEQSRLLPELMSVAGWRQTDVRTVNPRTHNSVHYCEGYFDSYAYRLWPDRAIVAGYNGIGILGADGWYPGRNRRIPGIYSAVVRMFWQGAQSIDDSMRAHVLLEGIQATEARIFIERALALGHLEGSLKEKAIAALNDYLGRNAHLPVGHTGSPIGLTDVPVEWQALTRTVIAVAAEIASEVGLTHPVVTLEKRLAAGLVHEMSLPIIGWTVQPRNWRIAEHPNWLQPLESTGFVSGKGQIKFNVNTLQHQPDENLAGQIVIADVKSGHTHHVALQMQVVPGLDLEARTTRFYMPDEGTRSLDYMLVNRLDSPLRWQIRNNAPWLEVVPSSGLLASGDLIPLRLTASAERIDGREATTTLHLVNAAGEIFNSVEFHAHVDDPKATAPAEGEFAYLADRYDLLYEHHTLTRGGWRRNVEATGPTRDGKDIITRAFSRRAEYPANNEDIGFDIGDQGFETLVTAVRYTTDNPERFTGLVRMQIITDGQVRFDSGLIEPNSPEIPVVLDVRGVRHIHFTLLARDVKRPPVQGESRWVEPRFYLAK